MASLALSDGTVFQGSPFGAHIDTDGEVVFNTGMAGYPESMTDPSYRGQILTFTYPLIGNYGVPSEELNEWGFSKNFESEAVHVRAVVCAQVSDTFSHFAAVSSLDRWMAHHGIPGLTGIDTRSLTKKLREKGVMLGRILQDAAAMNYEPSAVSARDDLKAQRSKLKADSIPDPNLTNLVAEVSCKAVHVYDPKPDVRSPVSDVLTVIAYDCGMKRNILRSFLKRGVRVVRVPWDFDLDTYDAPYDGVFVSNGPGDPKICTATIRSMQTSVERGIPTFGICLGNQLMALSVGGDTYKLRYGHRGCNQPCIEVGEDGADTDHCIITSQNHGYAVDEKTLPQDWRVWFKNANDGTVEGIRHRSRPFFAVQFHPEATPGPEDAGYLFDEFLSVLKQ